MPFRNFEEMGYSPVKLLATGEWAGVMNMIYTCGILVGLDESGYKTRFCYETRKEAEAALAQWDGNGDPPGNWIKQKGGIERMNPNYKKGE